MNNYILIFIGGGLGSISRFFISRFFVSTSVFPIGTIIVNVISCFIVGLFINYLLSRSQLEHIRMFILVGFCGGFSTFSAFSYEFFHLIKSHHYNFAFLYAATNIVLCLLFMLLGMYIEKHLF